MVMRAGPQSGSWFRRSTRTRMWVPGAPVRAKTILNKTIFTVVSPEYWAKRRTGRGRRPRSEDQSVTSPELSVVIPVFNEGENIGPLCERVTGVLNRITPDWEI